MLSGQKDKCEYRFRHYTGVLLSHKAYMVGAAREIKTEKKNKMRNSLKCGVPYVPLWKTAGKSPFSCFYFAVSLII